VDRGPPRGIEHLGSQVQRTFVDADADADINADVNVNA